MRHPLVDSLGIRPLWNLVIEASRKIPTSMEGLRSEHLQGRCIATHRKPLQFGPLDALGPLDPLDLRRPVMRLQPKR